MPVQSLADALQRGASSAAGEVCLYALTVDKISLASCSPGSYRYMASQVAHRIDKQVVNSNLVMLWPDVAALLETSTQSN